MKWMLLRGGEERSSLSPSRTGPRQFSFSPASALRILAIWLLIQQPAHAANRTWSNTATDFNNGASWGGTAPGVNDVAIFSNAMVTQPNLSASLATTQLKFSTTASSGYDITSSNTSIKLTLTSTGTTTSSVIYAANTSGTNTIDAPIILGAAAASTETFTQAAGGTLVINGIISSTNTVTLSLTGGIITLAGANTYSGGTALASATALRINNATALGTGTFTINGGTIDNTSAGSITLTNYNAQAWNGNFTFTGTQDLNLGTGAVTMNASRTITVTSGTLTVGGPISGATFGITKAGTGTLILNGVVGTTSGAVTMNSNSGTLTLAGNNTYTGGTTLNSGSTLDINAAGTSSTNSAIGTGTLTINGGTIDNTSGGTIALATNNAQAWNGDFTFAGSNNLNLGTGAVTMNASRIVTVNGGTLTVGGPISGATFGITKAGAGTMVLSGTNTYTGATTINAGTLSVSSLANGGSNSNLGASTNAATNLILNGGTLSYSGAAVSTDRLFSVGTSGGTIDASGSGAINFTNTGSMGFNGQTGTRTLTLTGTNTGSNTLTAIVGDNTGATSLVKNGAGTWVLTGTNTYSGGTTINAGTLNINNASALGTGTFTIAGGSNAIIDNTTASPITLSTNNAQAWNGNFTFTGTQSLNLGTGAVTLGASRTVTVNGSNLTVGGVISGSGFGLTKAGGGTLTLSGANTYSGATAVNAGTLNVNGSLASGSAVTVSNSGTVLGGTGTINGSVSIASSGAILEGGTGSTGQTLTLKGAVTMNSGSIIELALGASGTHSTLAISSPGSLTFATNQDFTFIGSPTIGTYTGLIIGVPNPGAALNSWVIDNIGYAGTFSWDSANGGEIDLNITAVPEPTTWIVGALALAALIYRQRRRAPCPGFGNGDEIETRRRVIGRKIIAAKENPLVICDTAKGASE